MAVAAGGKALAASGLSPTDIDLVIVATCTMPTPIPNAAAPGRDPARASPPRARTTSTPPAPASPTALSAAADAITRRSPRNVLVIGAEKLTDWVDQDDRSTGDHLRRRGRRGGGRPGPYRQEAGIGPVAWGSAGESVELITIPARTGFLGQEGQAVFRWATTALAPVALEACERAGVAPTELAAFIPHQANLRIVEAIARKLRRAPESGSPTTSSRPATPPRRPSRWRWPGWRRAARCASGDPVLLLGFGAGLTYAGQVVLCP